MLLGGIMELMQQSGLTHIIARFLMPVLRPLFGKSLRGQRSDAGGERECHGKSAGPVERRHSRSVCVPRRDCINCPAAIRLPDAVLTLIVLNSASIQLRAVHSCRSVGQPAGAQEPFDIMLPVWGASVVSVATALLLCRGRPCSFFPSEKADYQK